MLAIPFDPSMKAAALCGKKTCTSRNEVYGNPGDTFPLDDCFFELQSVKRKSLGFVARCLYRAEGFESEEEFKNFWMKLHPKKRYDPGHTVYVHFFALFARVEPVDAMRRLREDAERRR